MTLSNELVSGLDGGQLLDELRDALGEQPVDAALVEQLSMEVEERIIRADTMIGILPVEAHDLMADGFAAAGAAGRALSWLRLGLCYRTGRAFKLVEFGDRYAPDPDDAPPSDSALRCFAEAAALGERDAALQFASVSRNCSTKARHTALSFLDDYVRTGTDAGTDAVATYWYGLVQFALGQKQDAVVTHHRAADLGNADAMFELYVLYSTGQGVGRDDEVARDWLRRAADLGQHRALYNVAAGHATGTGFPLDGALAARYYERAAEAGNARAAATLGVMYLTGEGVPTDPEAALRWLGLAEEIGFDVDGWLDQLGLDRPTGDE